MLSKTGLDNSCTSLDRDYPNVAAKKGQRPKQISLDYCREDEKAESG